MHLWKHTKKVGCGIMFEWLNPQPEMSEFDKQLLASNIVGAKSLHALAEKEQKITNLRSLQLKTDPIQGNFDYDHFKKIHHHLFKDLFVWAGMDRYEIGIRGDFRKGDTCFTSGAKLPQVAKALFDALREENYFRGLEQESFIQSMASFMNGLNILHPFREGNGRTQRIFLELLAQNAGYALNLSTLNKSTLIQACIQGSKGNLKGFEILLQRLLQKE